jgi:hypothetical protein
MKKLFTVTVLALIALVLVPAKAQAPRDTFTLNWNGTGPEISSDYSLLQNVTALDDSGNAIHGTQIGVTALYEKPANQWSEGVTSMIELSYLLTDGSVESLALPLRCTGSGTGMSGTFSGEDNSGRTVTGSVTVLLKVECRQECWRNAKSASISVSYPAE